MGALLGWGGDRHDPQEVPGRGGATVMESFIPKFQVEGEPGLESTPDETCFTMSCVIMLLRTQITLTALILTLCLVGLDGGVELRRMGPI